jgi:hypothetical protein
MQKEKEKNLSNNVDVVEFLRQQFVPIHEVEELRHQLAVEREAANRWRIVEGVFKGSLMATGAMAITAVEVPGPQPATDAAPQPAAHAPASAPPLPRGRGRTAGSAQAQALGSRDKKTTATTATEDGKSVKKRKRDGLQRPHKCPDCQKSFTEKHSLARHVRKVHAPPSTATATATPVTVAVADKKKIEHE